MSVIDAAVRRNRIRGNSSIGAYAFAGAVSKELIGDLRDHTSGSAELHMGKVDELAIESSRDLRLPREAMVEWLELPRHLARCGADDVGSLVPFQLFEGMDDAPYAFCRAIAKPVNEFDASLALWISAKICIHVSDVSIASGAYKNKYIDAIGWVRRLGAEIERHIAAERNIVDRKPISLSVARTRGQSNHLRDHCRDANVDYQVFVDGQHLYPEIRGKYMMHAANLAVSFLSSTGFRGRRSDHNFWVSEGTKTWFNPLFIATTIAAAFLSRPQSFILLSDSDYAQLPPAEPMTQLELERRLRDIVIPAILSYPAQA